MAAVAEPVNIAELGDRRSGVISTLSEDRSLAGRSNAYWPVAASPAATVPVIPESKPLAASKICADMVSAEPVRMATVRYELSRGSDEPLSTVTDTTTPVCPTTAPTARLLGTNWIAEVTLTAMPDGYVTGVDPIGADPAVPPPPGVTPAPGLRVGAGLPLVLVDENVVCDGLGAAAESVDDEQPAKANAASRARAARG